MVMAEGVVIFKILLSALLGMIIGYEREIHKKPAGFRTHIFVILGATLFAIISVSFGGTADPSRIAAGVVTGIGFLGAGAIFHDKDKIKGLTTAADLWVLAAIGLAVGIGLYFVAVTTTVIMFLLLTYGKQFEKNALRKKAD